jgi:hypothetical protein
MSEVWVKESPIYLVSGAEPTFTITYSGCTTVSATGATMEVYKGGSGSNLAATLTTGSITASGNVLTLKKLQSLIGGNTYVVSVKATVDGVVEIRKIEIVVQKAKELQ